MTNLQRFDFSFNRGRFSNDDAAYNYCSTLSFTFCTSFRTSDPGESPTISSNRKAEFSAGLSKATEILILDPLPSVFGSMFYVKVFRQRGRTRFSSQKASSNNAYFDRPFVRGRSYTCPNKSFIPILVCIAVLRKFHFYAYDRWEIVPALNIFV